MPDATGAFSPRIVDSLVDALVVVESSGRVIYANPALGRLLGLDVADLFARPFTDLLPERLRAGYAAQFAGWMDVEPAPRSPGPSRISLLRADGSELPVDVATFLIAPESGPRLVIAALWDVRLTIDVDRYRRVADDLTAFLAGASGDTGEVIVQLLESIATSLDFDAALAWRWDDGRGVLCCEYGWGSESHSCAALLEASSGMEVRPGEGLPGLVVDADTPRWFDGLTRPPHLRRHRAIVHDSLQVAFLFPIRTTDHLVGVIELFGSVRRRPDQALLDAVGQIGARLGSFVERLELEAQRGELLARLEEAQEHLAFLLRANVVLLQADGFEETIHRLGEVAVPTLGDICLIDVVRADGRIERVTARHADPAQQALADMLLAHPPDPALPHPAVLAIRTREPQWSADMDPDFMTTTTQDRTHFELTQALGFRSFVSVPLIADGEAIGAITVVTTDAARSFGGAELRLAEDLARQVARVVVKARTFDEQSTIAHKLQSSLLPDLPPRIGSTELAVRYEAFGRGADVGGDFYDAVPLVGDRVAMVIGDVEGHDMTAATVMGQLRNALRAYLLLDHDPGTVLGRLSEFLAVQGADRFATACIAVLHTGTGEMDVASAGHPAPVALHGGSAAPVPVVAGPPLGVGDGRYPVRSTTLEPGSVLAFYTDGLIDVARESGADRLGRLAEALVAHGTGPCDALSDAILALLRDGGTQGDDGALLVLRWRRPEQERPRT